jgi:DNA-directed RNA polymerase specialized sigma24 family protein
LWSEVVLRVLRGIDSFDKSQPVSNWLNTIISNVVRNELRRLSRCRLVYTPSAEDPVAWGPHHPIDVPSFNRMPDEDLYIGEVGRAIGVELAALPEGFGAAVWLSFGEGLRLTDVSIALGVEKGTAKTRRWRGAQIAGPRLRSRLGLLEDGTPFTG